MGAFLLCERVAGLKIVLIPHAQYTLEDFPPSINHHQPHIAFPFQRASEKSKYLVNEDKQN
jgi:hypothetical protein